MSVNMKQNGSLTKIASLTKAIIPMGLAECYSTEEKEVGCWTDGKPLYQKTVYIANVTSGTSYAHGAENVENIFIKSIKAKRNVGWFSSGHIFQDGTGYISESFSIIPSPTVLYAYLYGNTISDCSVTIQYTKTTDTAGSGIWTPSGAQAVHYSTAEQIIGTWIDGKTLYQKTKVIPFSDFTSIQGGTRYVCPYKEANEEVKNIKGYAYSASYGYCFLGSKNYEADNTYTNYYWEFDNHYNNLNLTFIGNSASVINVSNVCITYEYTKTMD